MTVLKTRYELRIGEPAELLVPADTLDFLVHATARRVTIEGRETSGLVAAPDETQNRILLAPSSKALPGTYTVTLSATGQSGEERQTTLNVSVLPRAGIPRSSTHPPVVLLNGWIAGFNGTCTVATTSATTFGYLAQYLVGDGVPAVYLFDNCLEDPNQSIETLAADLNDYLNTIKYDDGSQVRQIDLVAHSMGGLIARAYLAGLQPNQTFVPPSPTLVRKLVLIATPNFGSFLLGNYATSTVSTTQAAELLPGSSFLWNLSTWNQHGDDLRGVDAIAVIGNSGVYTPSLSSSIQLNSASDGFVSLPSASLGFAAQKLTTTRIVPYCHVDPGAIVNSTYGAFNCDAAGIANVTSPSHYTSQIVRSFLAGTTAWSSIGTAPSSDTYLATNGGMFFAVQAANASYVTDLTQATWGTVAMQNGGNNIIYYTDFVVGSGAYAATSTSLGKITCGTVKATPGYSESWRCKLGAAVFNATPLASSAAGKQVAAGSTITLNGANLGSQCSGCKVTLTPANSTTAQTLTVTSWQGTGISVKLPAGLTGFATVQVAAATGNDVMGIMLAPTAVIAATPSSLQFAYTPGGAVPPAQSIQIANTGTATLAWTATASDSWLTLSATSGTAPSTLSVTVSPANLSPGTYNGTVQISGSGATPVSIPVTLAVAAPPPSLAVAPQSLTFQYTFGGALPASQDLSITNGGAGALSWTASSGAYWAVLSAVSGDTPGTLTVSINPANLAAGSYSTVVTIVTALDSVSPVSIPVTLVVQGTPPAGTITAVVNAGSYQPGIAPGTWVSIFGANLSQCTYQWQASDIVNGALPTSLQGVSVTIDGLPAYIDYISPTQINVLAPDSSTVGPVQVQVTAAQQATNALTVQQRQFAPAMLTLDGSHAAALHADYSLVGAPGLLSGATTTPAKPGEIILLYGVGFGPSNPPQPAGQQVAAAAPLANSVQVTIGGVPATVQYAGLVQSGLYQFNLTVPALPDGDAKVVATVGGVATQAGVAVTVRQ